MLTLTLQRKTLNCFAKSKIIAKLLCDDNFNAVKDNHVKLYSDEKIKPVPVPSRSVPYHLKAWVADSLENLIKIEEHPLDELVPWVFCEVIVPKDDNSPHVTLDVYNLNVLISIIDYIYIQYIYIYIHILYIYIYIYIYYIYYIVYIYISKDSYLSYYQTLS